MEILVRGKAVKSSNGTAQWGVILYRSANSLVVCLLGDHSIHNIQPTDVIGVELVEGIKLYFTPVETRQ